MNSQQKMELIRFWVLLTIAVSLFVIGEVNSQIHNYSGLWQIDNCPDTELFIDEDTNILYFQDEVYTTVDSIMSGSLVHFSREGHTVSVIFELNGSIKMKETKGSNDWYQYEQKFQFSRGVIVRCIKKSDHGLKLSEREKEYLRKSMTMIYLQKENVNLYKQMDRILNL